MAKVYDTATDLITFARSSSGTALRRVGYGENLVTNGTFDTDLTGWTATSDWSWSSGRAADTGTLGSQNIQQAITTEVGKVYFVTVTAYNVSGGSPSMLVGGSIFGQWSAGDNDVTVSGTFVASSTNTNLVFSGTAAQWEIDNVSVREVIFDRPSDDLVLFDHPDDIPRIEYAADGSLKGLLIEEQRTNLVQYSEDINQSFASQTGVSIEPAAATQGPISAAQRMVADTSTGFHRASGIATVQNGTDYTFSCFFQADGQDVCGLGVYTGTTFVARASFDLSTVQETVSNGSATIKSVGGGWYHCAVTGTTTGASATVYIYVNSLFSATGDGTSGIYVYGAQLELGSFATSYIPTSGGQSTRSPDLASIPVSAFGYNETNTVGTFFVEASSFGAAGSKVLTATNGPNRAVDVGINPTTPRVDVYSNHTGGDLYNLSPASAGINKVAAAMAENNSAACANGGTVKTDTATGTPVVATKLDIGNYLNGGFLNGHIKSLKYYPRRLTDAQLQELTA